MSNRARTLTALKRVFSRFVEPLDSLKNSAFSRNERTLRISALRLFSQKLLVLVRLAQTSQPILPHRLRRAEQTLENPRRDERVPAGRVPIVRGHAEHGAQRIVRKAVRHRPAGESAEFV